MTNIVDPVQKPSTLFAKVGVVVNSRIRVNSNCCTLSVFVHRMRYAGAQHKVGWCTGVNIIVSWLSYVGSLDEICWCLWSYMLVPMVKLGCALGDISWCPG